MANKEIHELNLIENLSTNDLLVSQQDTGESIWATGKFSLSSLGVFLNKILQYATDLQTTNKTIIGAINEVNSSTSGVTLTDTLEAGETSLVFTDDSITNDSLVDWYIDEAYYGIVAPTAFNTDEANHTLTLTFDAQEEDIDIKVVIK